jgi:hypothetical protein
MSLAKERKRVWPGLRYYVSVYLAGLRKTGEQDEEFSMPVFDTRAFRKFSSANSTLQASDDGVT